MESKIYSFPANKDCRFCRGRGCVLCASERTGRREPLSPVEPVKTEPLPEYLYHSALLRRGWDDALIEELLGEPDRERRNCFGVDCRMYRRTRVETVESGAEFMEKSAVRRMRQDRAKKGTDTKRERIKAEIAALKINIPQIDPVELIKYEVRNRNGRITDRQFEEGAELARVEDVALWPTVDPFRDRICVNFLRHGLTNYDAILHRLARRVGRQEAHRILRERIYAAIGERYPMLKVECTRQLEARGYE